MTDAELAPFVHAAAVQWCGEKERETSMGDIEYFTQNWRSLPGFRARVEALADPQPPKPSEVRDDNR